MTLEELLWYINDSTIVAICSINGIRLATYDGKDSIPEEYNDLSVTDILVNENALCIEVDI